VAKRSLRLLPLPISHSFLRLIEFIDHMMEDISDQHCNTSLVTHAQRVSTADEGEAGADTVWIEACFPTLPTRPNCWRVLEWVELAPEQTPRILLDEIAQPVP
jgi:hypothetical protein